MNFNDANAGGYFDNDYGFMSRVRGIIENTLTLLSLLVFLAAELFFMLTIGYAIFNMVVTIQITGVPNFMQFFHAAVLLMGFMITNTLIFIGSKL